MSHQLIVKGKFDASHYLPSCADSPACESLHGHTWKYELTIHSNKYQLNKEGMVVNFAVIKGRTKRLIDDLFDHAFIGPELETPVPFIKKHFKHPNPTCENLVTVIANIVQDQLRELNLTLVRVILWETENNGVELDNHVHALPF